MTSIFAIIKQDSYNSPIAAFRVLLALYIFCFHLIPRYAFYGYDIAPALNLELGLIQLFQGSRETNPAVLAFIVISGYCIHRNGLRVGNYNVREFLIRRAVRILPMFFIGTLLGALVVFFLRSDPQIATITNTQEFSLLGMLYKTSGLIAFIPYQFEQLSHQGNGPLITCCVELWLYACYPLLMLLILRIGDKAFWLLLCALTALGAAASTYSLNVESWWHNGSLFGFLIYWWIGVYAVNAAYKVFDYRKTFFLCYLALSIVLIFFPMYLPKIHLFVELRKIIFALLVAGILRRSEQMPSFSIFGRNFAQAGYSLYVLHVPLICLALYFNVNIYVTFMTILLLVYLSYLYIEKPCIRFAKTVNQEHGWRSLLYAG